MSKWDRVRSSMGRAHADLFDAAGDYTATFYNYADPGTGDYDPSTGEISTSRSQFGTADVEIVPPAMDSTVEADGTDLEWTTSIRFPDDETITSSLVPLGEAKRRPTEVEVDNAVESTSTVYELHGFRVERGSGMVLCRLVEQ